MESPIPGGSFCLGYDPCKLTTARASCSKVRSWLPFCSASVVGPGDWDRVWGHVLRPGGVDTGKMAGELSGENQDVDFDKRGVDVVQIARRMAHLG